MSTGSRLVVTADRARSRSIESSVPSVMLWGMAWFNRFRRQRDLHQAPSGVVMIDPGKVLDNIHLGMERLDLDPNVPWAPEI